MSAALYNARYVPTEDPPEVEEPFLGLLTSAKWVGGEVRYTEEDVLSAVKEHVAVLEERYRRLEELAIREGVRVGYDGAGFPVLLPRNWPLGGK